MMGYERDCLVRQQCFKANESDIYIDIYKFFITSFMELLAGAIT